MVNGCAASLTYRRWATPAKFVAGSASRSVTDLFSRRKFFIDTQYLFLHFSWLPLRAIFERDVKVSEDGIGISQMDTVFFAIVAPQYVVHATESEIWS